MNATTIDELNARFGAGKAAVFAPGPGGLPVAQLSNRHAEAVVCLQGAHVMAYKPTGREPVLWMSRASRFEPGEPIRGGIPVCWPWFGAHPADANQPSHGFARRMLWDVRGATQDDDGVSHLTLALDTAGPYASAWPHRFELELRVTVGPELRATLTARNTGKEPFTCSAALHSYFTVSDATRIRVLGLEGCEYIDTVGEPSRHRQQGPIAISEETDRIYLDTEADCSILDPGLKRRLRVAKRGSRTTVVWNPWIAKSARMPDFGDAEYTGMVCVETTNAEQDARTIEPAREHAIEAVISAEAAD